MNKEFWKNFDFWLFGSVVILCIFGIVMIRSAAAGSEGLIGLATRQIIWVSLGIFVILVTSLINYHYWESLNRVMYLGTMGLLIVIYVVGTAVYGSARWLDTGLVFVQPSELAKIVMILVQSDFFSKTREEKHDLRWIIRSFVLTMGIVVWILLQPNLSTSIVMIVLWASFVYISGLPAKYIAIFGSLGVLMFMIFIVVLATGGHIPFIQDYQIARVVNFLFPDPNASYGDSYNVEQALITIGSGGLFGQGYGHSSQVQLRYLKVRHTDFIFSAMAAEFGFIGTVLVVGLLVFVVLRCLRTARIASDPFGAYIAYGISTLLFFQMSVNIGVNMNIIPVTGLTLPFISYGGSSLLSLVLGIGLVESVAAHHKSYESN
jgi:rod shape determining protein RodA